MSVADSQQKLYFCARMVRRCKPVSPQDALDAQSVPAAPQETAYVPLGHADGAQDDHGAAPLAGQVQPIHSSPGVDVMPLVSGL